MMKLLRSLVVPLPSLTPAFKKSLQPSELLPVQVVTIMQQRQHLQQRQQQR
jgi:hypothetical protein